jgi:predicted MFS family arabinose efflux permease
MLTLLLIVCGAAIFIGVTLAGLLLRRGRG